MSSVIRYVSCIWRRLFWAPIFSFQLVNAHWRLDDAVLWLKTDAEHFSYTSTVLACELQEAPNHGRHLFQPSDSRYSGLSAKPHKTHDTAVDFLKLFLPLCWFSFQHKLAVSAVSANDPFDLVCDHNWKLRRLVIDDDSPVPPANKLESWEFMSCAPRSDHGTCTKHLKNKYIYIYIYTFIRRDIHTRRLHTWETVAPQRTWDIAVEHVWRNAHGLQHPCLIQVFLRILLVHVTGSMERFCKVLCIKVAAGYPSGSEAFHRPQPKIGKWNWKPRWTNTNLFCCSVVIYKTVLLVPKDSCIWCIIHINRCNIPM